MFIVAILAIIMLYNAAFGQTTAEDWFDEGISLSDQRKYNGAIQMFDKALEIEPDNANVWNNKGLALERLDRTLEANIAYAKAWYWKGNEFFISDKYDEAIEAFDKATQLDPDFALAWNNKGVALYAQGKYVEALQAYDNAIRIDPLDASAWNNIGEALKLLGRTTDSDAAFARAKELESGSSVTAPMINTPSTLAPCEGLDC